MRPATRHTKTTKPGNFERKLTNGIAQQKHMKQIKVGCYTLAHLNVDLYLVDDTGGEFFFAPEPGKLPRIKVGAQGTWQDLVVWLVHEAIEFEFTAHQCRLKPDTGGNSDGQYTFLANHAQFSSICRGAGEFMSWCLSDLVAEYDRWHKPLKKRRKRR